MFCNGLLFYLCWLGALWIAGKLAKSVGGADWREGWFAVECGLLLNYFGRRSSFCFVDGGLFVRISGVWLEEGLDGKECIRDE